ncbi:MAG: sigma-70 family RNA polymerase sigma factor [Polyangiaceae bacterium]|nr:sigma-70 family RNA polymerase sigma factor [Polyangiaceae bacterium]
MAADTRSPPVLRLVGATPPERPDALAGVARAAVAGDGSAVRTLLLSIGPHILNVVRRVLGPSHPEIDDVAQESSIALIDALGRHRGESTVTFLACRVAALTAMKARRRNSARKRQSIRDDRSSVELLPSEAPGPDTELSAQASADAVRRLLDLLPPEQAEALALHCVLGYTVQEIAEACQVPRDTVKSRLRLSKRALRVHVLGDPRLAELVERSS